MTYSARILPLLLVAIIPTIVFGQRPKRTHMPLGACNTSISEMTYGGSGADYAGSSAVVPTADSGFLLVGYTNSFGNGGYDGYAVRIDKQGTVLWSKTYGGPGDDQLSEGRLTSDGGFIMVGTTRSYGHDLGSGDAWLVRIDANGNLLWSQRYGDGNPYGEKAYAVVQMSDGGFAFAGDHIWTPGLGDGMVVRTDANGNMLWAKGFDQGGTTDEINGLLEHNDSLVVAGFYIGGSLYDDVLMKLDGATGNVGWIKTWDMDGRSNRVNHISLLPDGYLVNGANTDDFGVANANNVNVKTDFNGNIIFAHELHPIKFNGFSRPTTDGGYILESDESTVDPNADMYLTKVDKDGNVQWCRRYPQPGLQFQGGMMVALDGGFAAAGSTNIAGNFDFFFLRTDSLGQTANCTSTLVTASTRTPTITNTFATYSQIYDIAATDTRWLTGPVTPVVTSQVTADSSLCGQVENCLDVKLTGQDTICDMSIPVSYKAARTPGCITPVQWTIDNTYADILAQTDSTIQLQFKQTGIVKLYGIIAGTCSILQDSLSIQTFHPMPIDLGSNTGFCPGKDVMLDAGGGFQSYTWSTGETTQQITVTTPGDYWISAVNPAGLCLSGDTITIMEYPVPAVDLGPDRSICRDSVYRFDAGSGFSSYEWQDGSSNSDFYAGAIGEYWVKVTNQEGCSSSDTARILRIVENPKNFLETSDQICSQGQLPIQVSAIGNWVQYLWSDSTTGPFTFVDAPGLYWLQVTNTGGCTARDTVIINGKACPVGIFFPSGFTPNNDGNNDVFRPIVYAQLDKFVMAVYDRWGVKIFETNDPYKGWDGTFGGHPQPSGAFVWYSQYQLHTDHGKETVKKGTIMLLR